MTIVPQDGNSKYNEEHKNKQTKGKQKAKNKNENSNNKNKITKENEKKKKNKISGLRLTGSGWVEVELLDAPVFILRLVSGTFQAELPVLPKRELLRAFAKLRARVQFLLIHDVKRGVIKELLHHWVFAKRIHDQCLVLLQVNQHCGQHPEIRREELAKCQGGGK